MHQTVHEMFFFIILSVVNFLFHILLQIIINQRYTKNCYETIKFILLLSSRKKATNAFFIFGDFFTN